MMNDAARRLGMTKSRFNTPNGWPDEGRTYATANDLVVLSRAMMAHHPQLYRRFSGATSFQWRDRTLKSHDPVTGVVPGADGIKTGYTREAGYNFLGSAERGERRLVMVLAKTRSADQRAQAARALLEWGFSAWKTRPLFRNGEIVAAARVQGGAARQVELIADRAVYAVVPRQENPAISLRLVYRGPIRAPIAKGAEVAELEITVAGMEPGRIPLRAASAVATAGPMDRLWNGFMNLIS
jgi:D-alanyl-D-alanine carboxypeptidase (penicillin-binding protein 5/6)